MYCIVLYCIVLYYIVLYCINCIICTIIYFVFFQDLCQHTPENHPDFSVLKQSLNVMSDFIASTHDPRAFQQVMENARLIDCYLSLHS